MMKINKRKIKKIELINEKHNLREDKVKPGCCREQIDIRARIKYPYYNLLFLLLYCRNVSITLNIVLCIYSF